MTMKTHDGLKKPFFDRFLEHQLEEKERLEIQGGATLKYPSDKEDGLYTKPVLDIEHTLKYPSDGDEI